MPKEIVRKKGFTIIEVVLVLAIGGLIFLMVFVALPSLQRSQRDTQRKSDLDRVSASIVSYVSSNNKLPGTATVTKFNQEDKAIKVGANSTEPWHLFVWNYLLGKGDNVADGFKDPNGNPYYLSVYASTTTVASGTKVENSKVSDLGSFSEAGTMVVAPGFSCNKGELDSKVFIKQNSDGQRSFAIAMALEGGGIYCVDN